jgi:uncharacterized protein with beta-barrel porin domain
MMQIYFARTADQIKVGVSKNPQARLVQLAQQCATPLSLIGTIKGDVRREKSIHKTLAPYRVQGEWYRDCPEVHATIQNCFNNFDLSDGSIAARQDHFATAWKAIFPHKAAEELAARSGCSVRSAFKQLSGEHHPSAQSIKALSELGVPKWG